VNALPNDGSMDRASAGQLSTRIRFGGVVAGLAAVFIPAVLTLAVQWPVASTLDILTVAIPTALVLIGWTARRWDVRVALTSLGVYAYLTGIAVLDTPSSITWPPIASATFAASVVVISGTTGMWGILGIVASASLCAIGVIVPPTSTFNISVDLLGGWITPLVDIGLGLSFFIVLRIWDTRAALLDDEIGAIRETHRAALESAESGAARARVDRRIHETVLNTLNALLVSESRDRMIAQCQQDRASLRRSVDAPGTVISSVLQAACSKVPGVHVTLEIPMDAAIEDDDVRQVISDATTEALRNVERHSGVTVAHVATEVRDEWIDVRIRDLGRGMPADATARFGLRGALAASVDAIGGTVTWRSEEGRGTTVEIRVPQLAPASAHTAPTSVDFLLGSMTARIALVATVWIGLIAVPAAAPSFTRPWAIIVSFGSLVGLLALLIVRWNGPRRSVLSLLALLASLGTMVVAGVSQAGCSTATPIHWVIFSAAGAGVLISLARPSMPGRIAFAALPVLASLGVALTSPRSCSLDAIDAAIENGLWVGIIVTVITALTRRVDRVRRVADDEWLETLRLRTRARADLKAEERWSEAVRVVDGLLESVCVGSVDPLDAEFRAKVLAAQFHLRSQLELSQLEDDGARESWERFLSQSSMNSVRLRVEVLDVAHRPPGARLLDDLTSIVTGSVSSDATISLLTHSVLVRLHHGTIDPGLYRRWSLLEAFDDQGWLLECPCDTSQPAPA